MSGKRGRFGILKNISDESVDELLEAAKNEYNNENGRIASHDAKMNIMLPASMAYLLAIIAMERFAEIGSIKVLNVGEAILPVIALGIYVIGLGFAVVAVIRMLVVLLPKEYIAIETSDFYNPTFMDKQNTVIFRFHLYQRYVDATNKNREQNNRRMKSHKSACICMAISIFAIVIYNLIKAFMLEGD